MHTANNEECNRNVTQELYLFVVVVVVVNVVVVVVIVVVVAQRTEFQVGVIECCGMLERTVVLTWNSE